MPASTVLSRRKKWRVASANGSPNSLVETRRPGSRFHHRLYCRRFSRLRWHCPQEHIVNQTKILARFPQAGRKVPEFDDETIRELVVYSYRIIYRLEQDEALIVAVIHGKRVLQ